MLDKSADETEIASMKKSINDALEAEYYDRMQALDGWLGDLKLITPVQKDYALMQDAINMLQEQIRDSNDLEYIDYDYQEETKEFYEELLEEEGIVDLHGGR